MTTPTQPTPQVSVVLTVFNQDRYCRAAIDSVLLQTLADFELIVVDDGSTDDSAAVVDACAALDPRIQVIHTENRGVAPARNLGITRARANLIACLDGDDVSRPQRLEKQVRFLNRHPEVGVVGGAMNLVDADGTHIRRIDYPAQPDAAVILQGNPIGFSTAMMRRALAVRVGGFRSICSDAADYDMWLRISEHAALANLNETLVDYRWHGENTLLRAHHSVKWTAELAKLAARRRRLGKPDPLEQLTRLDKSALDLFDLDLDERIRLLRLWVPAKEERERPNTA